MKTLLAACALAAFVSQSETPKAETAPKRLADLAWLAGTWASEEHGHYTEEMWTAPRGGTMLGVNRDVDVAKDKTVSWEFLRIVEDAKGVNYLASPGGRKPTAFAIEALSAKEVVFANPEHDFPKRIRYALDGDALTATVEGDGGKKLEFRWKRVTSSAR